MTITPELERPSTQPKPEVPPQQAEPPKETLPVEERGLIQASGQPAAQVIQGDGTQQVAQAPAQQLVTITVPTTTQQLDDWSKGSPDDSLTWLAFYWVRMIKKAFFHGYRVVTQSIQQNQYA
jgi:hypothetical protein